MSIFKTKFGKRMEKYNNKYCMDISIIDDNICVNLDTSGENRHHNGGHHNGGHHNGGHHNGHHNGDMENVKFIEKHIGIKGHVQSGKTRFTIAASVKNLMLGYSTIVILRNVTNDLLQTKDRFKTYFLNFKYFKKLQKKYNLECDSSDLDIFNMLTANPPTICIILANETSMEKINTKITQLRESYKSMKYNVIIDEVDAVDSTNANVRKDFLNNIKSNASQVIGLTATILGTYSEWNLKPNCVRELSIPVNYIGIDKLEMIPCDTGFKNLKITDNINQIFDTIPCLKDHVKKLAVYDNNNRIIELMILTCYIEPQKKIFEYVSRTYLNIAIILMVESGVKIYHPSLGNSSISANRLKSKVVDLYTHSFSNKMDIGAAMGLLERINNTTNNIENVLILAGNKASRAVTFSSTGVEYDSEEKKLRRWHANIQLSKFTETTTQDNAIQHCRLPGIYAKGTIQKMYASVGDIETVKKAYYLQEDLLDKTSRKYGNMQYEKRNVNSDADSEIDNFRVYKKIDNDLEQLGGNVLLNSVAVSNWKVSTVVKTKKGKDKTKNRDITNRKTVCPKLVENDGRNNKIDFGLVYAEVINLHNLNTIRPEWKTADSIIAKFMRNLVQKYKEEITRNEFLKMAEEVGSTNPSSFIHDCTHNRQNNYGLLFENTGDNKYRLIHSLHKEFEKVFIDV